MSSPHAAGGANNDRAPPLGFISNFDVPTAILARRSARDIVQPGEALRRASPEDITTRNVSFEDYLSPEDAALFTPSITRFQTMLAARLRGYVGTDLIIAMRACVGATEALWEMVPLSMAIDERQDLLMIQTLAFRYFVVPGWYEYVIHVYVRIDTSEGGKVYNVPSIADDDPAPLFIVVTTTSSARLKRLHAQTFT